MPEIIKTWQAKELKYQEAVKQRPIKDPCDVSKSGSSSPNVSHDLIAAIMKLSLDADRNNRRVPVDYRGVDDPIEESKVNRDTFLRRWGPMIASLTGFNKEAFEKAAKDPAYIFRFLKFMDKMKKTYPEAQFTHPALITGGVVPSMKDMQHEFSE